MQGSRTSVYGQFTELPMFKFREHVITLPSLYTFPCTMVFFFHCAPQAGSTVDFTVQAGLPGSTAFQLIPTDCYRCCDWSRLRTSLLCSILLSSERLLPLAHLEVGAQDPRCLNFTGDAIQLPSLQLGVTSGETSERLGASPRPNTPPSTGQSSPPPKTPIDRSGTSTVDFGTYPVDPNRRDVPGASAYLAT